MRAILLCLISLALLRADDINPYAYISVEIPPGTLHAECYGPTCTVALSKRAGCTSEWGSPRYSTLSLEMIGSLTECFLGKLDVTVAAVGWLNGPNGITVQDGLWGEVWARQQYTGIEGRTWGMDNCNYGYSELGPFEMLCWTPSSDPGGPGQAGMDCDLERALHQVDPSYPLSELCGYVADPPCNPDNPYGYCYDPCHLNPSLCYFPPTCDEQDPNSSCYNPPPSCDPNDPSCNPDACPPGMQDCHYPPCDPSDPYGGCYVDTGECNSRNPNCDPPPACDPNDPGCS